MEPYWYVDEDINIYKGEAARKELEKNSDAKFLTDDKGIIQVPRERWKIAQKFERTGWMQKWAGDRDDRNLQHKYDFEGYECLKGLTFKKAIELGCGPFTNLRFIGEVCSVETCSLLDPLLKSYLKHPHRSYNVRRLNCEYTLKNDSDSMRFFRRVERRLKRFFASHQRRRIPVRSLFPMPIEEMPTDEKYDLIILINVIEHCYDINLVFEKILKIASPNAVLVFHDKYYDHQKVMEMVRGHYYEAGHPLMVDRKLVNSFLENFKPLFRAVIRKETTYNPAFTEYDGLFFIGQFLGSSSDG